MPPILLFQQNDTEFYGGVSTPINPVENKNDVQYYKVDKKKIIKEHSGNNVDLNKLKSELVSKSVKHSGKDELPNIKDLGEEPSEPGVLSSISNFIDNPTGVNNSDNMETEARLERQGREVVAGEEALKQVGNDLIIKPVEAVKEGFIDPAYEGIIDSATQVKESIEKSLLDVKNFGNQVLLFGGGFLLLYMLRKS
tara:strand:- start:694 stop:1281 length:588 start_codon:yes stop_codon:yes gene_type:complete